MTGKPRLGSCAFLCLLPLPVLAARLVYLQVLEHGRISTIARGEFLRNYVEIIPRGRILDRRGRVLAQSLPASSAFLDPSLFRAGRRGARLVAGALGLNEREVRRKAASSSRFAWLKRKLNPSEARQLQALRIDGVGLVQDQRRYYPNGDLARSVIGAVGVDDKGLSGLETEYDRVLGGAARRVPLIRDGSGNSMEASPPEEAEPARDIVLTIDRNIQHLAEEALRKGVETHHPRRALVAVQDPRTGDLLAAADYPAVPSRSMTFQYAYEPGSTFKIVAMTGALEEGLTRPEEIIDVEGGRWQFAPKLVIRDDEPHRALTVAEVLEQSSNIGMAKLGLRLGPERLYRWTRAFGFGTRTGVAFPGESAGLLTPPERVSRITLADNAFGQGVAVTPIQLLGAYSAIANGGTLLEPRLVRSVGGVETPTGVPVRKPALPRTIGVLRGMLEGVVERGTGAVARIPGYRVAGKTGTAQKIDPATGRYSPSDFVASFIGFAPVPAPRWTILVVMDGPKNQYHGAETAAPVFADLLRQLLALEGVPPDRPADLSTAPGRPAVAPALRTPTARPGEPAGALRPDKRASPGARDSAPPRTLPPPRGGRSTGAAWDPTAART